MRYVIIIVILIYSFLSCTDEKQEEIPLFNDLAFKLYEGETMSDINSEIKNRYTAYFNSDLIQVPLFRYIHHDKYDLFIGIPYSTSIEAMIQHRLDQSEPKDTCVYSDSTIFCKRYKNDDYFIREYAIMTSNKSLIYLATMSRSKEISISLLNEDNLSKRLTNNPQ